MQKQQITTGTPIPPEWYNAMQTPTYEGTDEEVGHLPLPPEYDRKIEVFQSIQGSVDLSTATSRVAMVYHNGSATSLQKETLSVNVPSGCPVEVIFLVPVGTDYELDVVLPVHGTSTTTVNLKAGASGIFKRFSYGGNSIWKHTELNRRDCTAYFASIVADTFVQAPKIRLGDNDHNIDIEYDLDEQHSATYLGLLFGGYGGLSSSLVIHFPLIHVWKQATFEKDVTVNANMNIQKSTVIGSQQQSASLSVYGQIFTPFDVLARNVPGGTSSIGQATQEGGTASYLEWQYKDKWTVGQVKKIFNDTGHNVTQEVLVPEHAGNATQGTWKAITIPSYCYKEFTCVGYESGVGAQFAILAPSA